MTTENSLELLRQQIREAEIRLQDTGTTAAVSERPEPAPPDPEQNRRNTFDTSSRSREKIRILQRSFRALLQATPDAFILVDPEGGWELANGHLPEWLGYTEEEFAGIQLTEIFEPQEVKTLLESFPQWFDGIHPLVRVPMTLQGKDGATVPVLLSSYSWVEDEGQRIAYLVMEDSRARNKLESQVTAFRTFLDSAMRGGPIPMVLLTRDGHIADLNEAACRWLGLEAKTLRNSPVENLIHESSSAEFEQSLQRAFKLKPTANIRIDFQTAGKKNLTGYASFVGITDTEGSVSSVCCALNHRLPSGSDQGFPAVPDAYGWMAPELLKELTYLISACSRNFSDQLKEVSVPPPLVMTTTKLLESMDRVRDTLSSWGDSAEYLRRSSPSGTLEDAMRRALISRRSELDRLGIKTELQFRNPEVRKLLCPPVMYPVILHILQSCIEEIRECSEGTQLSLLVQILGERLELSFVYELPALTREFAGNAHSGVFEHLRFKNIELRAARMLLDSISGTLMLENVSDSKRAIRMHLGLPIAAPSRKR